MKAGDTGINSHIQEYSTSLADFVKIARTDGINKGFTSLDVDLIYDGLTYKASTAITRTNIETVEDLSVPNLDIEGLLDSTDISEDDIRQGKYQNAEVYFFTLNFRDVTDGIIKLQRGIIGQISLQDNIYVAELRGLTQKLNRPLLRTFTPECQHTFGINDGSIGCFFDLDTVKESGTVATITSNRQFTLSGLTSTDDDTFNQGKILWKSGNNTGLYHEVKDFVDPDEVYLFLNTPFTVQVGDTCDIYQGCDKRFVTCQGYDQVENYGGFPHVPGQDELYDFPDARM